MSVTDNLVPIYTNYIRKTTMPINEKRGEPKMKKSISHSKNKPKTIHVGVNSSVYSLYGLFFAF